MRRLEPLRIPGALAPLLVAALAVPIVAAFALGGPPAGLAVGALAATAVIVVAVRARYDQPIEVASAPGDRYRLLVLAVAEVEEPAVAERIAREVADGARATELDAAEPEVLVLAPALNSPMAHWASDLDRARFEAQRRLAVSIATLSAAGVDARGAVGDSEPLQAAEDVLRTFSAHELAVVAREGDGARKLLSEVRRRLDRPVVALPVGVGR